MSRRVVITGVGAVTPAGGDAAATWRSLVAGRSAVAAAPRLAAAGCRSRITAEVQGFDPERIGARQDVRRMGRCTQLALAAALEAWRHAGLATEAPDPDRAGVLVGTAFGDSAETYAQVPRFLEAGRRGVAPGYVTRVMVNAPAARVSIELGLRGPSLVVGSACAAGGHAIALASRLIRHGDADVMVAGGADEISCPLAAAAFDALGALSTRNEVPARASRPFDGGRDGFVLGEGAGMVVLEAREHAVRRGAPILAELAGVGLVSEAHHLVAPAPDGAGAARAMAAALADAGRAPADVRHVNAHGTSTPLNDAMETRALHAVLGAQALRAPVSATKSMIGHSLGAAAAIGLVATVLAIRDGLVHPTVNLEVPDPACDLDYVPGQARALDVELALVNAFAFGGHCVSLAVQRPRAA